MPVKLNKNAIERHEVIEIHFPVAQRALRAAIYRFVHFASGRATVLARKHIGPRAGVSAPVEGARRDDGERRAGGRGTGNAEEGESRGEGSRRAAF